MHAMTVIDVDIPHWRTSLRMLYSMTLPKVSTSKIRHANIWEILKASTQICNVFYRFSYLPSNDTIHCGCCAPSLWPLCLRSKIFLLRICDKKLWNYSDACGSFASTCMAYFLELLLLYNFIFGFCKFKLNLYIGISWLQIKIFFVQCSSGSV